MRTLNKRDLIIKLKKEEAQLKLLLELHGKRFVIGYLCKLVNCHVTTAEYIVRRIIKYGKI